MPRLEHQKKLINRQLTKYLTLIEAESNRHKTFLIDHAARFKYPKRLTQKNITRHNLIIKYSSRLLKLLQ